MLAYESIFRIGKIILQTSQSPCFETLLSYFCTSSCQPGLLRELGRLEDSIKTLVDVASAIRVRRVARGGLELDSIEITVRFADPDTRSGKLEDLVPKEAGFLCWDLLFFD